MARPVVLEIRKKRGKYWLRTRSRAARGALKTEGVFVVPEGEIRTVLERTDVQELLGLPPRNRPLT